MTLFSGVRAVTFDCWGTLISEAGAQEAMIRRVRGVASVTGRSDDEAGLLLSNAWQIHFDAWHRHEQYGSTGMAAWIASETGLSPADRSALALILEEASRETGVDIVPGACATLRAIKDAGFATALICDTGFTPGRVVRELLGSHGLTSSLDALIFSDEVGVPKPDRRMFAAAFEAIGGGPAVHVGDLRRTDVAGARSFGLGSVRFRGVFDDPSEHPDGDVVIDSLAELTGLLGLTA